MTGYDGRDGGEDMGNLQPRSSAIKSFYVVLAGIWVVWLLGAAGLSVMTNDCVTKAMQPLFNYMPPSPPPPPTPIPRPSPSPRPSSPGSLNRPSPIGLSPSSDIEDIDGLQSPDIATSKDTRDPNEVLAAQIKKDYISSGGCLDGITSTRTSGKRDSLSSCSNTSTSEINARSSANALLQTVDESSPTAACFSIYK
jgi:hypothetical protein